ncbi:MAG: amidase [Candidatus Eisenbacteria bacterium]|uniref:Amidase n=1 Tax=Eiseniibacteriota bacterium TaxID=2212470 RepID=A0A538SLL3_UNCEI|nr:MAG: amidase [Candidatus Eisenbacteria bacterium]
MLDPDTFFLPVRELGARIRDRRLSPVELTGACLDRLERLGGRYHAVVSLMRAPALREARAAEQEIRSGKYRGPLHGIPYGAKDLLASRGVPTTWGAAPYRHQVFDYDATVVERLREAGAILVAKLAMVELAGGMGYNHADASFTGPGLSPWNTRFWSGGSSSGPGAAVAAGLVPFAIGSETSGSILTPAAFCGVTGLRPTYGLVSRHGAMALCWTLDKLGPMGRTADDCGLVLASMAGLDPDDPSSLERGFAYDGPAPLARRPRLAVPKGVTEKVQPEVRENFERSLGILGELADVKRDVEWPDFPWGPAVSAIVGAEGASAFLDLIESGRVKELKCPKDRHGGYAGTLIPAVDYLQAMRLRAPMKRALADLFEKYDLVVAPTRASVAYPADKNFDDAYPGIGGGPALIAAGNLCGLPALAVPNGFGENGLPTSLSLMGKAFSEGEMVALGDAYQQRSDWHARRPPGT